jgi:hypothetical protein
MFSFFAKFLLLPLIAFAGGAFIARHWDEGAIADLKLDAQTEMTRAAIAAAGVQKREDAATLRSALANAAAQEQTRLLTRIIIEKVPTYVSVKSDRACSVPNGFVRVFDAAAGATDPAVLPGTAGEPDDAASGIALSQIAALSAENAARYHAVAQQLSALQAWVEEQRRIANSEW